MRYGMSVRYFVGLAYRGSDVSLRENTWVTSQCRVRVSKGKSAQSKGGRFCISPNCSHTIGYRSLGTSSLCNLGITIVSVKIGVW